MKKLLLTLAACASLISTQAQEGVYQIPNSDFENWAADNEPGNGWYSFASATGDLAGIGKSMSPNPEKTKGYNSNTAVKLVSKFAGLPGVLGANANGNLTTGIINMGDMTPENPKNFNFTDLDDKNHQLLFAGTPDAVSCWAKFKSGGSLNGRGQFILHDEYEYRDPESSNETGYENHKIALAAIIITESSEWTYFEAPFTYTGVAKPEKQYMLASFTTNPVPGGSINDELIIDDVKLIYYSQLASLSYDGTPVANFKKDTYNYSIDAAYDESKLEATADGVAATIEKYYNKETGELTITVKGDDWSEENKNEHVYTIQFKTAVTTNYTNDLTVSVNGDTSAPQETTIQLIEQVDGTYSFALKNFCLGEGKDKAGVGNIQLDNLTLENGKISTSQGIQITAGDDPNITNWMGPTLTALSGGSIPVDLEATVDEVRNMMTAKIVIDMTSTPLKQMIDVTFAPSLTANSETSIADGLSGLYNVTLSRTFAAGWNTVCLPFATTVAALGAEQVQAFTAFADNTLTFTKVADGNLAANTPYLIYFEKEQDLSVYPIYMSAEIESSMPESVIFGDVTFTGNYTAGMSMVGLYGVAEQNGAQYIMKGSAGSTLGSTGAYFTVSGTTAGVNTLSLDIEGEGTTGIESIVAEEGQTFDVYTLTGVKVRTAATGLDGLQRGIYIVNGKKVLVK